MDSDIPKSTEKVSPPLEAPAKPVIPIAAKQEVVKQEAVKPKITEMSIPKPEQKENRIDYRYMPWWMSIVVFILVLIAYGAIYIQGYKVNEVTEAWAIIVSGTWAGLSVVYRYI